MQKISEDANPEPCALVFFTWTTQPGERERRYLFPSKNVSTGKGFDIKMFHVTFLTFYEALNEKEDQIITSRKSKKNFSTSSSEQKINPGRAGSFAQR